jgi:O-antigen ligase/polysaccharide polymerase Wzy-like membrane protein
VIPAIVLIVILLAYRPWQIPGDRPALHVWLSAIAGVIVLQLVPLPPRIVDRLSPVDRRIWQSLSLVPVRGALPLSVDLASTVWALGVVGGALVVFVIARQVFAGGGVRIAARGIASVGLVLAAVSLAQDATAHGLMYWRWKPLNEGAPPFGPFVNRNHFATWIVMAVPVCLGYLLAHASAHKQRATQGADWHKSLLHLLDARSIWLASAICLMLVALVASLSRAGMAGLVSAIVLAAYLRGRRTGSPAATWVIAVFSVALIAAVIRVNPVAVVQRFGAVGVGAADRLAIWRATLPVVKDFWLTGSGAGTFETVILVYQRTPSLFRISGAHNHYLQVAAEGGLLIGVPVAVALWLFVRESRRALAGDESGMYFLRAGALSGLVGVAVQSIWETGLTTPANAVLAALAAAIVVHRSAPRVKSTA